MPIKSFDDDLVKYKPPKEEFRMGNVLIKVLSKGRDDNGPFVMAQMMNYDPYKGDSKKPDDGLVKVQLRNFDDRLDFISKEILAGRLSSKEGDYQKEVARKYAGPGTTYSESLAKFDIQTYGPSYMMLENTSMSKEDDGRAILKGDWVKRISSEKRIENGDDLLIYNAPVCISQSINPKDNITTLRAYHAEHMKSRLVLSTDDIFSFMEDEYSPDRYYLLRSSDPSAMVSQLITPNSHRKSGAGHQEAMGGMEIADFIRERYGNVINHSAKEKDVITEIFPINVYKVGRQISGDKKRVFRDFGPDKWRVFENQKTYSNNGTSKSKFGFSNSVLLLNSFDGDKGRVVLAARAAKLNTSRVNVPAADLVTNIMNPHRFLYKHERVINREKVEEKLKKLEVEALGLLDRKNQAYRSLRTSGEYTFDALSKKVNKTNSSDKSNLGKSSFAGSNQMSYEAKDGSSQPEEKAKGVPSPSSNNDKAKVKDIENIEKMFDGEVVPNVASNANVPNHVDNSILLAEHLQKSEEYQMKILEKLKGKQVDEDKLGMRLDEEFDQGPTQEDVNPETDPRFAYLNQQHDINDLEKMLNSTV